MIDEQRLALYLMLGQGATREVRRIPGIAPQEPLKISAIDDLATLIPDAVTLAYEASEPYKLFFVFERYLRQLVIGVLSRDGKEEWWDKLPQDVKDEVTKLEETEEVKNWMALGSRDKSALVTYPQLLKIIDHCWKDRFQDLLRDKALVQEARLIAHLRNAVCHMTPIPEEDIARIKQTMRDWFRRVAP
jgi:hypothetical protein